MLLGLWEVLVHMIFDRCDGLNFLHSPFFPLSVSLWNDLADPAFDGVGLAGFKSRANAFLLA